MKLVYYNHISYKMSPVHRKVTVSIQDYSSFEFICQMHIKVSRFKNVKLLLFVMFLVLK